MRIHYFQHVPFEGLGSIEKWIASKGYVRTATRFYADDTLPDVEMLAPKAPFGNVNKKMEELLDRLEKTLGQANPIVHSGTAGQSI